MIEGISMNGSIDSWNCWDDLLQYVTTKPWRVILDETQYERVLAEEVEDVLDAAGEMFSKDCLTLFFIIAWNDLKRGWNRKVPFLTETPYRPTILKYLWLQDQFKIPGTTALLFSVNA